MLESNKFLVADPIEFSLAFERELSICGLDIYIEEDGVCFTLDDLLSPTSVPDLCLFLKKHLKDSSQIIKIRGDSHILVTKVAYLEYTSDDVHRIMENEIYPKLLTCITSCKNNEMGTWIEKGEEYLIVGEHRSRGRQYYIVKTKDGHELCWSKEYFNGR